MNPLTVSDVVWRILAATVAGALIGLERESHGRAAGLRTTILACVASALAMIVSQYLFVESPGANWHPDPARLGAGILTGIGFLGGGTILRHDNLIRGVTTAASLWFVTVLGLAFGSGLFVPGLIGLAIALITLLSLPLVEKHIRTDWYSTLSVTADLEALKESELRSELAAMGLSLRRMTLDYDLGAKQKTISCELKLARHDATELSERAVAELRQRPGVRQIKWS